jgi:hypothetical protein
MPGIPPRPFGDWSVQVAALHLQVAEDIHMIIDGRVVLGEVLVVIESMGG